MNTATDQPICGLVNPDLVRRIIGDAPIDSHGNGIDIAPGEPAQCKVQDGERGGTVMQLSIGEVDPEVWQSKLAKDAQNTYGECVTKYEGDPGDGYGCTYDTGIFRAGAAVHVLKDNHLIRATVYNWPEATPEMRLALAEDVARDLEKNYNAKK